MPRRMIPVRHRETGQVTSVSEQAYGYFAGHYERLDQPAEQAPAADTPSAPTPKAPEGDTTAHPAAPTARPTTAPKTKE